MGSPANAIWPHLPSDQQQPKRAEGSSLSGAMWPSLTPEAKKRAEDRARDLRTTAQGLREARMKIERKPK